MSEFQMPTESQLRERGWAGRLATAAASARYKQSTDPKKKYKDFVSEAWVELKKQPWYQSLVEAQLQRRAQKLTESKPGDKKKKDNWKKKIEDEKTKSYVRRLEHELKEIRASVDKEFASKLQARRTKAKGNRKPLTEEQKQRNAQRRFNKAVQRLVDAGFTDVDANEIVTGRHEAGKKAAETKKQNLKSGKTTAKPKAKPKAKAPRMPYKITIIPAAKKRAREEGQDVQNIDDPFLVPVNVVPMETTY